MEERLIVNALKALSQLLDLRREEVLLIVTDEATAQVGEAFLEAARRLEANPILYSLPEKERPLKSLPEELAVLVPNTDVAVTCFQGRSEETPFRIELIRALMRVVRRLGHAPGITTSMLAQGPMDVDYSQMALKANELIGRFDDAVSVHITAPGGTDISMKIEGRLFETDTVICDGRWGNLPAGEIWCAPVEDSANGVIACDGSIGDLGAVPATVYLYVTNGRIEKMECSDKGFLARVEEVLSVDEQARVIGELGIGLNPGAKLTGNLLEDEKAGKTAHIAFGNNEEMSGGKNTSRTHRDFLFRDPSIDVTYSDGRTERIIEAGVILSKRSSPRELGYRHIVVAIDFSDSSKVALRVGDALARLSNATLTVCHVIHSSTAINPLFPHQVAVPDPALMRLEEEEALKRLDALVAKETGRGADEYDGIVSRGIPAEEIVRIAKDSSADLVVVASLGHGRIGQMLLGSVAEAVARNAHCQVLVAR